MTKHRMTAAGLILGLLLLALTTAAQDQSSLSFSADRQQLTVGDPVTLTLSVTHPAGYRVLLPDLGPTWNEFDVRRISLPQIVGHADGTESTTFGIEVTLFRPGEFSTAPLTVAVFDRNGQKTELTTEPLRLTVNSVLVEGDTTLRDIKGQAELPLPVPTSVTPLVALGILLLLGLLVVAVYDYRRRRKPQVPDSRPPYQVAFDELRRIESLNLPARDDLGAYCDLISACVRQYVESGLDIPATERTTSEIKGLLRQSPLKPEQRQHRADCRRREWGDPGPGPG